MTKKISFYVAVVFTVLGANVYADADVVAPFGIKMGSPDSCNALDKYLRSLDPTIKREPQAGRERDYPILSNYKPMHKVFPGALNQMLVLCEEDKLRVVSWGVDKGVGNAILSEVVGQLDSKYQRSHGERSLAPIYKNGGSILYSAGQSNVKILISGERNHFSLVYEFTGPITNESIDAAQKQKGDALLRKGAL
jgi:hypothetical protein